MTSVKQHTVETLRDFRTKLLDLKKDQLSAAALYDCLAQNRNGLDMASAQVGDVLYNRAVRNLAGHERTENPDVLDELRRGLVGLIDVTITRVDSTEVVRPILDELILKVRDVKLATLLKEFNAAKDAQPNIAAIGFRTILSIVIQERAKLLDATSELANREDLQLKPVIEAALSANIFPSGEARLLREFLRDGLKSIFDIITHKPGRNSLANKDNLSSAVELLNRLLPTLEPPA